MTDEIFPGPRMLTENDFIDEDGKPITELPYFLNPFSVTNSHVVNPPYQSRSFHSWDFPLLTGLQKQYGAIGDGTSSIGGRVIPLGEVDDHSSDHIIVTHSYDVNDRKKYQLFAVSGIFIASFMLVITIMMSARTAFPAEQSLLRTIIFKQVLHPEPPTKYWGSVTKPYPTGAFWTNLVVRTGDGAIGVYPYGVKTTDTGVQVNDNTLPHTLSIHTNYNASTLSILSNTHSLTQVSYGYSRRTVTTTAIIDPFYVDLQIGATQGFISRAVESYDNVSVTVGYKTTLNGKFRTHLVKGAPSHTTHYPHDSHNQLLYEIVTYFVGICGTILILYLKCY